MSYPPRLSIITAVYNGREYLEQCIDSIRTQTYGNVEHIVIDGGSTDGTQEVLQQHGQQLAYWVSEPDRGIYHAWNKGLARATGEWIAFVGADDRLRDKHVLENMIEHLHRALQQNIRYVYGKIDLLSAGAGNNIIAVWGQPWEIAKKDILQHMTVTHCCAFHHRSLFDEYGSFNEQFRITGDYEFLLRAFVKGDNALFTGQVVAAMHAGGLSANIRSKLVIARENILARRLNGLPPRFHHRIQLLKARVAQTLATLIGRRGMNILSDTYRSLRGKDKLWSKID
ncbi:MAG TPA: glycosyltransferase family 2 protein [Puia sp.]|nr:glycosyltransferase family 2 protein [Puia sp.]